MLSDAARHVVTNSRDPTRTSTRCFVKAGPRALGTAPTQSAIASLADG